MDIVIPFVESDDDAWLDVFLKAKNLHPKNEKARQIFFVPFRRRYSSHGLFKYWWRALEPNYKSLTKVHLLLMQPSQFPSFLNKDDPRIVVHYHNEFIPEKHRPCFNSATIELCAIKELDLKGNFILANDDMYANAPVDDSCFEQDGKPLAFFESRDAYGAFNQFRKTLTNGHKLVLEHYAKPLPYYHWHHLFQVYNAEFCKTFLDEEWGQISKGLGKWRGDHDYNHMLLMMAQNISGMAVHSDKFPHIGYFEMPLFSPQVYAEADTRQVVCFNDTTGKNDKTTREYLARKYPNKSSFEV